MKQYFNRRVTLPQPGDIRELVDRRTGKVQHLARVRAVDPGSRQVELSIIRLDRNGRERK